MAAKSKSAQYYAKNPAARKRKGVTDKKINARPSQIKKRVESNAKVRDRKKSGKSTKGMDYDHATNSFVKTSTNRGRAGEGGRKKKSRLTGRKKR